MEMEERDSLSEAENMDEDMGMRKDEVPLLPISEEETDGGAY